MFWDTEIFLLPFYTFTWPEAARALLMYRFNTLPAARRKASRLGFRGALYAWESADTGDEVTPEHAHLPSGETVPILSGIMEHHISADIAFAVWQYWQATADAAFLRDAGAEIVLETARFWASRASREADGRYHIRGVIGPDEYHEAIDDNAYTNLMARWNLETGVAVARLLQAEWPDRWGELAIKLALSEDEVTGWETSARDMYTGLDDTTQLFEQFDGFFGLEHIDLAAYEPRQAPMDVLLGRDRTQRSQVSKQADVVMAMALLWPRFTPQQREVNFRYYESRCGHGSSLSPPIHALVAARLGDATLARRVLSRGGIDRPRRRHRGRIRAACTWRRKAASGRQQSSGSRECRSRREVCPSIRSYPVDGGQCRFRCVTGAIRFELIFPVKRADLKRALRPALSASRYEELSTRCGPERRGTGSWAIHRWKARPGERAGRADRSRRPRRLAGGDPRLAPGSRRGGAAACEARRDPRGSRGR